jgi:hypothetical protein
VRDAPARADRCDLARLIGGLGAQPVVDGDGDDACRRRNLVAPRLQQLQQRQRIAAARNGGDDGRAPFEAVSLEDVVEFGGRF